MMTHQEISQMIQRIKQEPIDAELQGSSPNYNTQQKRKRKIAEDFPPTSPKKIRHLSPNGKPTIPCLMCDRYFENQDELMIHMALDHQCNTSQGNRRQVGRLPKHTCQICFAKFRTFRDLFTHTAFHAKHMHINGDWSTEIGTRIEKNLVRQNTIRQYFSDIQNDLSSEIHGTFKCDCCNNVFMNRDTYAMHVMMRVKDDMCKQDDTRKLNTKEVSGNGDVIAIPAQSGQEYLIDVTTSEIEDEYLKSALSVTDNQKAKDDSKVQKFQGKKCIFCTEYFLDQDSMAMHVMSVHSNANTQSLFRNIPGDGYRSLQAKRAEENNHTRLLFRCQICGNSFDSRDSLSMHTIANHSEQNDNNRKVNQIEKDTNELERNGEKPCITVTEISTLNTQDEPLNLASEKKNQKSIKQNEEACEEQNTDSDKTGKLHAETVCFGRIENKGIHKRTRSMSVPGVRENDTANVAKNRPASTGGIRAGDVLTPCQSNNPIAHNRHSPVCYSYEQPDMYMEDRQHVCQLIGAPQNDPLELLLQKRDQAHMCNYCETIFLNRTLYYLHMGLHNVNNPLQCNMCGKTCDNIHDFSVHVMHL